MKACISPFGKLDCLYSKKKVFKPKTAAPKLVLRAGLNFIGQCLRRGGVPGTATSQETSSKKFFSILQMFRKSQVYLHKSC